MTLPGRWFFWFIVRGRRYSQRPTRAWERENVREWDAGIYPCRSSMTLPVKPSFGRCRSLLLQPWEFLLGFSMVLW